MKVPLHINSIRLLAQITFPSMQWDIFLPSFFPPLFLINENKKSVEKSIKTKKHKWCMGFTLIAREQLPFTNIDVLYDCNVFKKVLTMDEFTCLTYGSVRTLQMTHL